LKPRIAQATLPPVRNHGAVKIDRQAAKIQLLDSFIEQFAVEAHQCAQ
jgi:hypothetical protein